MQSKALLTRLKRLEQKKIRKQSLYIFLGEPSKAALAKLPKGAKVLIITGEDEIKD